VGSLFSTHFDFGVKNNHHIIYYYPKSLPILKKDDLMIKDLEIFEMPFFVKFEPQNSFEIVNKIYLRKSVCYSTSYNHFIDIKPNIEYVINAKFSLIREEDLIELIKRLKMEDRYEYLTLEFESIIFESNQRPYQKKLLSNISTSIHIDSIQSNIINRYLQGKIEIEGTFKYE